MTHRRRYSALAAVLFVPACATGAPELAPRPAPPAPERGGAPAPDALDAASAAVLEEALAATERRIVVSRDARQLWLMEGDEVLLTAPVAVGRDTIFRYRGKAYDFQTPRGNRVVQDKETDPIWVPPEWHYFEKAVERDLEPVQLEAGDVVKLSDGTRIEVRGRQVGRVNTFGNFWPFTPGAEIIFDGKIFIPPFGTDQRKIPEILGTHRLILGDGYLIHGTPEVDTIGEEASHGCVRMRNEDVASLYALVGKGTKVFIY